MNILVLCTGNSTRSILLECIFNRLGKGRVAAYSAGSKPIGTVHPNTLALLKRHGYNVARLRSKSWDEFRGAEAPAIDAVITVSGHAQDVICPGWLTSPLNARWGVQSPAAVTPPSASAFDIAYAMLEARAKAWLSLDFERMDTSTRQHHLTRIGEASLVM